MKFCVKCGEDCEDTIDGLCVECFLDGRKLTSLPHHIDLQVCANCGEFSSRDSWVMRDRKTAVEDAAVNGLMVIKEADLVSVGAISVEQDASTYEVFVDSVLGIGNQTCEDKASTIVRVKNTVCKRCSRLLGSYYESILQIRTGSKNLSPELREETLARVENSVANQARTNRQLFITKMEIVSGGVDVYLSSISLGKMLAKDLADTYCAEMGEAAKLVGRTDDGHDMYRVTYLIRLPDFHVGDIAEFEGRNFKITRVASSGGKLMDLSDFRERTIRRGDMPTMKILEKAGDIRDATVISRSGNEIQIMSPSDYSTVDLRIPDDAEIGETVRVASIEGIFYYVP